MVRYLTRLPGEKLLFLLVGSLLCAGVAAGCGLASATRVNVATFYTNGAVTAEPGARALDEARAALHVKIRLRSWSADRTYAKVGGSLSVGAISGVHWTVRAGTPGNVHSWPSRDPQENATGQMDRACS